MVGKVRRMFLGGNTGYGFYSFYEQVVSGDNIVTYILKGGPGTGKSTIMRHLAQQMLMAGFDREEFYCSSDSTSLDGLFAPAMGVYVVDGTAPHVVEPRHPGAVDKIIDLGRFWQEAGLRAKRHAIRATVPMSGFWFRRAYAHLRMAKGYNDEKEAYIGELGALDIAGLNSLASEMKARLLCQEPVRPIAAKARRLFASAITPQGLVHHLPSLVWGYQQRILLQGQVGSGRTTLVQKVAQAALERGYDIEVFHCALDPERIDHVLIPNLGIAVLNNSEPHSLLPGPNDVVINTDSYVDDGKLAPHMNELAQLTASYETAIAAAISYLQRARNNHAHLEHIYAPHMDFAAVSACSESIWLQILQLARSSQS